MEKFHKFKIYLSESASGDQWEKIGNDNWADSGLFSIEFNFNLPFINRLAYPIHNGILIEV